ncbi:protein TWIN LOV 1-like isoform X2 [Tasmannia lanceolata]|uniref:protein TWIN LOV 1-like isoform X2 n=1 Tax=Tasmannia lanceolata TaxID=3420 RepID=UPI004062B35C
MGLRVNVIIEENIINCRKITAMESQLCSSERLSLIDQSLTDRYSDYIRVALDDVSENFLITDPCISGHPIVFASRGFLKMSGYSREEVVGKNGRVFQGPNTDRRSVSEVREAIRAEETLQISLLNYRKDGMPFWILFHLSPVFSKEDGRVVHFVAVQVPISRKSRLSGSVFSRNWGNLGEDCSSNREIVFGSCRREVCMDSGRELGHSLAYDSFVDSDNRVLEAEESCEANDMEKQKAATAISNILSALIHYSELTGKVVCGKRCSSVGIVPLGSSLIISLGRIKQSFVLTDPDLPDMPIVYASDAFLNLTGYARHEVVGHNCRFLQGTGTDFEVLCQIREAIQTKQACTVRILNYRKDRSSFWNLLHISPVRNASGKVAFYVGVQMDESSKNDIHGLSPEMWQLGAVGAVKVAVRSLSVGVGSSKS